jgi:hypothetical protein
MDIKSACRVGTKITHSYRKDNQDELRETFVYHDVCLIYEDQDNKGCYIALSQPTSKVGFGQSQGEAYIDLVISLLCAIWHGRKTKTRPYLGVESKKKVWESLEYVYRMAVDKQNDLLKEVIRICPRYVREDVKAKGKGLLSTESTYELLDDTFLDICVPTLKETIAGSKRS